MDRALPGYSPEERSTISRALGLLHIDVGYQDQDPTLEPKLVISLSPTGNNHSADDQNTPLLAEFDADIRAWRLRRTSSSFRSSHSYSHSRPTSNLSTRRKSTGQDAPQPKRRRLSWDTPRLETISLEGGESSRRSSLNPIQSSPRPRDPSKCQAVSGAQESGKQQNSHEQHEYGNNDGESEASESDWTSQIPRTEHNTFLLNTAWEKTSLGPMSQWPLVLRLMTLRMLRDPRCANLYWGPDRIAIYNEPFSVIASSRHPFMMGATAEAAMPATWPFLKGMMQQVEDSKEAFTTPEFEMEVWKEQGFLEEAWYEGVFAPITDTTGNFVGIYNSGDETTAAVLPRRYGRLIHSIAAMPDFSTTTPWQHIVQSCDEFVRDVPMLLVYSADPELHTSTSNRCILHLEGSLGFPHRPPVILRSFDLSASNHALAKAFNSSKASESPTLLDMPNGQLPTGFEEAQWRGWPEASTHIAVMPSFANGLIAGFVVMGLNPRRPYDDDLKQLVNDVWRTVSSVITSSISSEQARAREKILVQQLTQRERFVRKMAEVATVGIYSLSDAGMVTYANARYHEISNTPIDLGEGQPVSFEHYILDDDLAKVTEAHEKCKSEQTNMSINVRLKQTWTPPGSSTEQYRWVMNSILPDVKDGRVEGIIGSIADIGHTMWALQLQKESTQEALASKQHLERFIDMTSHEMRNPLGAALQCADDIIRCLDERAALRQDSSELHQFFESIKENAKTISFCSIYQKSIADDILVASKLSSSLMSLSPAVCQPELIVNEVMQMFKSVAAHDSIDLNLKLHQSYTVTWAMCDAPRVRQILINLLTNAIKFTKGRPERRIDVVLGASKAAPPPHLPSLTWHPRDSPSPPQPDNDSELFLTFEVRDTGKGLTGKEMSRLFTRFSQANVKTAESVSRCFNYICGSTTDAFQVRRLGVRTFHLDAACRPSGRSYRLVEQAGRGKYVKYCQLDQGFNH